MIVDTNKLAKQLIEHEGIVLMPYRCSSNKLTIGVGRNLEDNGITKDEAMYLLGNDISRTVKDCEHHFDWFHSMPIRVREAVVNLVFNMGVSRFSKFKKTIEYLKNEQWERAGVELLDSRYAEQTTGRAVEIANQIAGT
jgi:lysozyme